MVAQFVPSLSAPLSTPPQSCSSAPLAFAKKKKNGILGPTIVDNSVKDMSQSPSSSATLAHDVHSAGNGDEELKKKLRLRAGSHSHIGRRTTMEDTHVTLSDARNIVSAYCPDAIQPRTSFFAVYDGHAGVRLCA